MEVIIVWIRDGDARGAKSTDLSDAIKRTKVAGLERILLREDIFWGKNHIVIRVPDEKETKVSRPDNPLAKLEPRPYSDLPSREEIMKSEH